MFGFLKGLSMAWRLAIAAAILAALAWAAWSAYAWAHDRGARSRDPEVATLTGERDTAKARVVDVTAANRVNAATIATLRTANTTLADGAREQQARARAEAGALRARLAALGVELNRSRIERASAYENEPSSAAWARGAVPAAVDRSLRH
jgi:Tfp pilus assembly major pilin PilA